jgi:hypothetical protein
MTDERTLERLMVHLRAQVAEARRLELEGADQTDLEQRRRLIFRLQQQLAYAVRDLLTVDRPQNRRPLPSL